MSHDSRLDLVSTLRDTIRNLSLDDGSPTCVTEDSVLVNTFKLIGRIGSGSINGEAFKLCHPIRCGGDGKCECRSSATHLAVKRVPIKERIYLQMFKSPYSRTALHESLFVELLCLKFCNFLVEAKVTPNLPLYVNYFICNSCVFQNKELKTLDGEPCIILINELATEGDIKTWSEKPRSPAEWYNAFFQIFNALDALQKYFNLTHHDLHWGNVLVQKVPKGGFWRYNIDGNVYDVPNLGWLFIIWDFGVATIPGKMDNSGYAHHYRSPAETPRLLADYHKIISIAQWRENDDVVNFPFPEQVNVFIDGLERMYEEGSTLKEVMKTFKKIYPAKKDNEVLSEFSSDISLRLPEPFSRFLSTEEIKSRRPSLDEVRFTKFFKKFQKNTVVPIRKNLAKQLMTFATSEAYGESFELSAANYPPEPVTDIEDPDDSININTRLYPLLDSTIDYQKSMPKFVSKMYRKLEKYTVDDSIVITRAEWARFIKWLILIDVPFDTIRPLAEPVRDYFANGVLFELPEDKKKRRKRTPDIDLSAPTFVPIPPAGQPNVRAREVRRRKLEKDVKHPPHEHKYAVDQVIVAKLLEDFWEIFDETEDSAIAMESSIKVTGLIRRIYSYLSQLDRKFDLDPNFIIRAPKDQLHVFSCILSYVPWHLLGDNSFKEILDNPKTDRYIKLLMLAKIFVDMLREPEGTEALIDLLHGIHKGDFNDRCGKITPY